MKNDGPRAQAHEPAHARGQRSRSASYDGASGRRRDGGACGVRSGAMPSGIARSTGAIATASGDVNAGKTGATKSVDWRWQARIDGSPSFPGL